MKCGNGNRTNRGIEFDQKWYKKIQWILCCSIASRGSDSAVEKFWHHYLTIAGEIPSEKCGRTKRSVKTLKLLFEVLGVKYLEVKKIL